MEDCLRVPGGPPAPCIRRDLGVGSAQHGEELVGTWLRMSPFPSSRIQGLLDAARAPTSSVSHDGYGTD